MSVFPTTLPLRTRTLFPVFVFPTAPSTIHCGKATNLCWTNSPAFKRLHISQKSKTFNQISKTQEGGWALSLARFKQNVMKTISLQGANKHNGHLERALHMPGMVWSTFHNSDFSHRPHQIIPARQMLLSSPLNETRLKLLRSLIWNHS